MWICHIHFNRQSSYFFFPFTDQPSFPSTVQTAGYTVLYCITMAAALTGNALLIFIIKRRPDTKSTTGFLFVNMAVADLLVTLFVMPVSVAWLYSGGEWLPGILGHITCTLVYFTFYVTLGASILSLSLMSVDRYLAVIFSSPSFLKISSPKSPRRRSLDKCNGVFCSYRCYMAACGGQAIGYIYLFSSV